MLILAKLIGIIVVLTGVIFLLNPQAMKQYINFLKKGNKVYLVGISRLVIGGLFLYVASQCRLRGAMIVLGILCLIGGVLIFVLGLQRVKKVLDWYDKKPLSVLRILSLLAIAIGALIIYSV